VARDLAAAAREYSAEALGVIYAIMTDRKAPHSVRLAAAMALLDRSHGRPTQRMMVDLPEADPSLLSDRQLVGIILQETREEEARKANGRRAR
jgi:hypothetical protein